MNRIWHPWDKWEDFRHNFHGGVTDDWQRDKTLELYAGLLRDLDKFEAALKIITTEWKYSCEHNLTHMGMNRVAYLGQAACALTYGVPHQQSMGGYNLLTDAEKAAADAMAQKYVDLWVAKHEREINVNT